MKKLLLAAAVGSLAVAAPAVASGAGGGSTATKCTVKNEAYTASGRIVSWNLTKDPSGKTYSGTLTIHVSSTNHHAKTDKHGDITYTVSKAHVSFAKGVKSPYTGDKATVTGTITFLSPHGCTKAGYTQSENIKKISVTKPPKKK